MTTKTYSQNWVAYDKAKTKESMLFKAMLLELLETYFNKEVKRGKRIPNKDRLFMMALGFSSSQITPFKVSFLTFSCGISFGAKGFLPQKT